MKNSNFTQSLLALSILTLMTGCLSSNDAASTGSAPPQTTQVHQAGERLVLTSSVNTASVATQCGTRGGETIKTGFDWNGNGTLDATEVDQEIIICHGESGTGGGSGLALTQLETSNSQCPTGGILLTQGSESYPLCNAAQQITPASLLQAQTLAQGLGNWVTDFEAYAKDAAANIEAQADALDALLAQDKVEAGLNTLALTLQTATQWLQGNQFITNSIPLRDLLTSQIATENPQAGDITAVDGTLSYDASTHQLSFAGIIIDWQLPDGNTVRINPTFTPITLRDPATQDQSLTLELGLIRVNTMTAGPDIIHIPSGSATLTTTNSLSLNNLNDEKWGDFSLALALGSETEPVTIKAGDVAFSGYLAGTLHYKQTSFAGLPRESHDLGGIDNLLAQGTLTQGDKRIKVDLALDAPRIHTVDLSQFDTELHEVDTLTNFLTISKTELDLNNGLNLPYELFESVSYDYTYVPDVPGSYVIYYFNGTTLTDYESGDYEQYNAMVEVKYQPQTPNAPDRSLLVPATYTPGTEGSSDTITLASGPLIFGAPGSLQSELFRRASMAGPETTFQSLTDNPALLADVADQFAYFDTHIYSEGPFNQSLPLMAATLYQAERPDSVSPVSKVVAAYGAGGATEPSLWRIYHASLDNSGTPGISYNPSSTSNTLEDMFAALAEQLTGYEIWPDNEGRLSGYVHISSGSGDNSLFADAQGWLVTNQQQALTSPQLQTELQTLAEGVTLNYDFKVTRVEIFNANQQVRFGNHSLYTLTGSAELNNLVGTETAKLGYLAKRTGYSNGLGRVQLTLELNEQTFVANYQHPRQLDIFNDDYYYYNDLNSELRRGAPIDFSFSDNAGGLLMMQNPVSPNNPDEYCYYFSDDLRCVLGASQFGIYVNGILHGHVYQASYGEWLAVFPSEQDQAKREQVIYTP